MCVCVCFMCALCQCTLSQMLNGSSLHVPNTPYKHKAHNVKHTNTNDHESTTYYKHLFHLSSITYINIHCLHTHTCTLTDSLYLPHNKVPLNTTIRSCPVQALTKYGYSCVSKQNPTPFHKTTNECQ